MCDFDDNRDNYGFERYQPDGTNSISFGSTSVSSQTLIIITVIILVLVGVGIFLLMGIGAGYYSWQEFPYDKVSNKLVKSIVAGLFSPFYLIYTLVKIGFVSNTS
tara:strand:- start:159 stop:473 length:315 start_codon:yes stop_codon:yes gene_type:complete